jgi:hypothetical protein
MNLRTLLMAALLSTPMLPATMLHAQTAVEPHCTEDKKADHYLCDAAAFQRRLALSKTVRVDTARMDSFGNKRMTDLAGSLGKQIAAKEQRPDLILDLSYIDRSGRIDVGPADVALATLSVYDPSKGAGKRGLIWVETFDGQEDRPWPSIVVDLIRQFRTNALHQ